MKSGTINRLVATSTVVGIIAIEINDYREMLGRLKGALRRSAPSLIDRTLAEIEKKGKAITFYEEMLEANGGIKEARRRFGDSVEFTQHCRYNPHWEELSMLERERDRLIRVGEREGYFLILKELTAEAAQEVLLRH